MDNSLTRFVAAAALAAAAFAPFAVSPSQAGSVCTVVTEYGNVHVGCVRRGSEFTFSESVHGYTGFTGYQASPSNPGCYNFGENGVLAFCGYRR